MNLREIIGCSPRDRFLEGTYKARAHARALYVPEGTGRDVNIELFHENTCDNQFVSFVCGNQTTVGIINV